MKLRVSSRPERFRRCGMEFTRTPREIDVKKEVAERLKAEPMLVVEEIREDRKPEQNRTNNDKGNKDNKNKKSESNKSNAE